MKEHCVGLLINTHDQNEEIILQDSQWWALWYGGFEAIPSPGNECLTACQALERHNGVIKQALPDG